MRKTHRLLLNSPLLNQGEKKGGRQLQILTKGACEISMFMLGWTNRFLVVLVDGARRRCSIASGVRGGVSGTVLVASGLTVSCHKR